VCVKGSGPKPYELKYNKETNVYSCTCTVWRHVPVRGPDKTCRHLWSIRGKDREIGRVGEDGIAKMERAEEDLRTLQRPPVYIFVYVYIYTHIHRHALTQFQGIHVFTHIDISLYVHIYIEIVYVVVYMYIHTGVGVSVWVCANWLNICW
jgi:hypothetical protein